ncbi:hypothetical protein EMCRGX_G032856 [Ephydatia muelleri]
MASVLVRAVRSCTRLCVSKNWIAHGRSLTSDPGDHGWSGGQYTTDMLAGSSPHKQQVVRPMYRVLDHTGKVLDAAQVPDLSNTQLVKMLELMVTVGVMDQQLYKAQRMGLISFYMMSYGEEAVVASAAALAHDDMVFAQYREPIVLYWRGYTIDQVLDQCFGNRLDLAKGRQMPVHFGSKDLHFQFISSPLSTQMPQAPGYAYGMKLSGKKNCVICYFGDGAAQEGDAHAAMNFSATLGCPVIFFCRNNGYAISTPTHDQYAGDGIVSRGPGYGIESIRVDGNDVFAIYNATKHAREVAVNEHRPVLIESMSYRLGSHSTSDDQTGYQDMSIVEQWKREYHPTIRLRNYLLERGLWDAQREKSLHAAVSDKLKKGLNRARDEPKPHLGYLFEDVHSKLTPRLERQKRELMEHIKEYKDYYPLNQHES